VPCWPGLRPESEFIWQQDLTPENSSMQALAKPTQLRDSPPALPNFSAINRVLNRHVGPHSEAPGTFDQRLLLQRHFLDVHVGLVCSRKGHATIHGMPGELQSMMLLRAT
jgi:hypothetical protein